MKNVPVPINPGEKIKPSVKRQWLLDQSFKWVRGPLKNDGGLFITVTGEEYELKDTEALKAFKELALCIKRPRLIETFNSQPRSYSTHLDKDAKREWIYALEADGIPSDTDIQQLNDWVTNYGLPFPTNQEHTPGTTYHMVVEDITVIASISAMAWQLFELTQTKKGCSKIKDLAYTFQNGDSVQVSFGIKRPIDYPQIEDMPYPPKATIWMVSDNPDKWSAETWRRIALLWITRMAACFIDVKIETRFTNEFLVRPVLQVGSFMSWLWLHFVAHMGETDGSEKKKRCACGEEYIGRAKRCPECLLEHKNGLKKQWRINKEKQDQLT